MAGDERTFGGEFSDEGVARLRERINEKLKEFMGDYTDDTLVEYVTVLLKNGRRKDEAKGELNVFLGDDSDAFVTWLWDHLGSHLSLYVQTSAPHQDQTPDVNFSARKQAGKTELQLTSSEAEKRTSEKTSGKRYNREGKGLQRDKDENVIPLSRNSLDENVHAKDNPRHRVDRTKLSRSPRPITQKKRRQTEEQRPKKRKISQETISAPKRLLQFAVREAVGTSRVAEPSLKRLRSVISASTDDVSPEEHPRRTRQVAGLRADMSAAIKAVSDAVKDLSKDRSSRNVFDRLNHPSISSNIIDQEEFRAIVDQADFDNESEDFRSTYDPQNDGMVQQDGSTSSFDDNPVMASDFGVGYDDYDDVMGQRVANMSDLSRTKLVDNSVQLQYGATNNSGGRARRLHQHRLADMTSKSFKIASSANMSTLRSPEYQEATEGSKRHNLDGFVDSDYLVAKSEAWMTKDNNSVGFNGHAQPGMDSKQALQMAPAPIGGPTEDADSRTIFLSNVHFAATKDSLSRHFNKFGDVLKVIILTDPATGQPKGSAYIEFMRKEAAEHALSLDGTSFMSRFLKIVRKSSVQPEATSLTTWPRVARASPFTVPRFSRGPYARGIPALFRSRIPSKAVARSFQWKRGTTLTETSTQASNSVVPPLPSRSLTYVRTEPKANGSSGTV
ncbi:hypothetical protein F511_13003 [Dorcoceras hygrometricum]|uniref:RRM domain-containing protein n=1 Tax=Dorcoceras hygrometricum TaxID=472368 RepID=A0A2Z7BEB1_9LAMI|nr:hypothetical protein F511_13003 [Dorcoceras hygrometricum]